MNDGEKTRPKRRSDGRSRSVSRLTVVQALYQMELSGQDSESAIAEFLEHRIGKVIDEMELAEADHKYFAGILRGVVERQDEIDRALARATGKTWSYDRIDAMMRAIFRAGSFELISSVNVPVKVVLAEYLNVASAFFEDKSDELTFISGVLHRIARDVRPAELAAADPQTP